jgi:hypothetical protein
LNVQEQIAKLESLLDRVRRNVQRPRAAAEAVEAAAPALVHVPVAAPAIAEIEFDEPAVLEPMPDIEDLDMMEVEMVEIAVDSVDDARDAQVEADSFDEPIPESAPRAAAGHADELEHEVPIKTPPPESGRQVMAPSIQIEDDSGGEADLSGSNDVDSLLEADLSGGHISRAPERGPSMEQLGETVELEGADAPAAHLELDAIAAEEAPPASADELELDLPKQHYAAVQPMAAPPPVEVRSAAAPSPPQAISAAGPTLVERPAVDVPAAEVIAASPQKIPETFIELLDASLGLRV